MKVVKSFMKNYIAGLLFIFAFIQPWLFAKFIIGMDIHAFPAATYFWGVLIEIILIVLICLPYYLGRSLRT